MCCIPYENASRLELRNLRNICWGILPSHPYPLSSLPNLPLPFPSWFICLTVHSLRRYLDPDRTRLKQNCSSQAKKVFLSRLCYRRNQLQTYETAKWGMFPSAPFPSPLHSLPPHIPPHMFIIKVTGGIRAVASLTVTGGWEFQFPHFSSNFDQLFIFSLKLNLFSSSLWLSRWAMHPPRKALATPLWNQLYSCSPCRVSKRLNLCMRVEETVGCDCA